MFTSWLNWGDKTKSRTAARKGQAFRKRRALLESLESRHMMATFTVDTLIDESDGNFSAGDFSMREAIEQANATTAADVIDFDSSVSGTISLNLGEFVINQSVQIIGPGAKTLAIDAQNSSRVFNVFNGAIGAPKIVEITDITLRNGTAIDGGAVLNDSESLVLNRMHITDSTADVASSGGGGAVSVKGGGSTVIYNSTLDNNTAHHGGAIDAARGILSLINSTVSGNNATTYGGGVYVANISRVTITHSTITNNRSDVDDTSGASITGGGIANQSNESVVNLNNSIIAGNYHGPGFFADDIYSYYALYPTAFYNIIGDTASRGGIYHNNNGNFVGNSGSGTIAIGTLLDTNLADNGGSTPTHALVTNSRAINTASLTYALDHLGNLIPTDQRSLPREASNYDRGAYEVISSFIVDTLDDELDSNYEANDFSLREALQFANAATDTNTITFRNTLAGNIYLSNGELEIKSNVTINGPGYSQLTLDGRNLTRIFNIQAPGTVTVNIGNLTLANGHANRGGAIYNNSETLILNSVYFVNNDAYLLLQDQDRGGGAIEIDGNGTTRIFNSTLQGNHANHGGAINVYNGSLHLINTTISGNSATGHGGGVRVFSASSTLRSNNATIVLNIADSDNDASGSGGGVFVSANNPVVRLSNTLVAGNTKSDAIANDVGGTLATDSAYNLIAASTTSGGLTNGANGNLIGNGGTGIMPIDSIIETALSSFFGLPTHLPTSTSQARDHGSNALAVDNLGNALAYDSRGKTRIRDANADGATFVDIGAVETQPPVFSYNARTASYSEGASGTALLNTVTDDDSPNFNGGRLLIDITNNASPDDRLFIVAGGNITLSGANVYFSGRLMGTFTGGTGATELVITLTTHATPAAVDELYRRILYKNVSQDPSTATRTIKAQLGDGRGGLSLPAITTMTVTKVNDNPVLSNIAGTSSYRNGNTAITLAATAAVTDFDNANFAGGALRIEMIAGAHTSNRLTIGSSFTRSGSNLLRNGVVIGTVNSNGGVGTTALQINFNSQATKNIVTQLLRSIKFNTTGGTSIVQRNVRFTITDGSGGTAAASRLVTVTNT
jgi:hypothetical protein